MSLDLFFLRKELDPRPLEYYLARCQKQVIVNENAVLFFSYLPHWSHLDQSP